MSYPDLYWFEEQGIRDCDDLAGTFAPWCEIDWQVPGIQIGGQDVFVNDIVLYDNTIFVVGLHYFAYSKEIQRGEVVGNVWQRPELFFMAETETPRIQSYKYPNITLLK